MKKNLHIMRFAIALILIGAVSMAPSAEPLRIMCLGDSITTGYTDNPKWDVPFEFGYRSGLYKRLTEAGYTIKFVGACQEPWNGAFGKPKNSPVLDLRKFDQDQHRGYGGWGTKGILDHVREWLAADKPDIVLLMAGINDGGSVAARQNLDEIVQAIVTANPTTDVIVAQITPMAKFSQTIVDYNVYIRDTLVPSYKSQGKRVSTVDQYANLIVKDAIETTRYSNGINHPNAETYERMAQTWFDGMVLVRPLDNSKSKKPNPKTIDPN
jgi:lysophospholipase L1-like esterase